MSEIIIKKFNNVFLRNNIYTGGKYVFADNAFVSESKLGYSVHIGRRNVIVGSQLGDFTYTNSNTSIRFSKIGKFCSISSNCYIGGGNIRLII